MYRIFNKAIESEIPLPELPSIDRGHPAISISLPSSRRSDASNPDWSQQWYADAEKTEVVMAVARVDTDILLSFPTRADFLISAGRDRVECFPADGAAEAIVRHLLLDQVIPRVMGQDGDLVLHASAVETPDGAGLVFLGNSGWGKSTIASSFYRCGSRLVADDCLLLREGNGRLIGVPSYSGSRLWTDSATAIFPRHDGFHAVSEFSDKKRLILHDQVEASTDIRIDAVFLLRDPGEHGQESKINILRVDGAESIMAMIRFAFMLDADDIEAIARQFTSAGRVATTSPAVYSLAYPRDFARLAEVREAIGAILAD